MTDLRNYVGFLSWRSASIEPPTSNSGVDCRLAACGGGSDSRPTPLNDPCIAAASTDRCTYGGTTITTMIAYMLHHGSSLFLKGQLRVDVWQDVGPYS